MEAQQQYKDNIPDPSEWSQDYPWYESSTSKMPKENSSDHMEIENGEDITSTDTLIPYRGGLMGRREGLDYCSSKACQTGLSLMAKGTAY
ncbi:hypothetical protein V6N11_059210 [Hibiscus sabdariffa]|uniref:Uncharacterized protein n=1 Tax=Hibiscus sabdariffa TaxID=183260 RepID=A0ABR2U6H0_9ROSI